MDWCSHFTKMFSPAPCSLQEWSRYLIRIYFKLLSRAKCSIRSSIGNLPRRISSPQGPRLFSTSQLFLGPSPLTIPPNAISSRVQPSLIPAQSTLSNKFQSRSPSRAFLAKLSCRGNITYSNTASTCLLKCKGSRPTGSPLSSITRKLTSPAPASLSTSIRCLTLQLWWRRWRLLSTIQQLEATSRWKYCLDHEFLGD